MSHSTGAPKSSSSSSPVSINWSLFSELARGACLSLALDDAPEFKYGRSAGGAASSDSTLHGRPGQEEGGSGE